MSDDHLSPPERVQQMHDVLAGKVRSYRKARGWTQHQLAKEMAKLGYPIDRVTLSKLEAGGTRAENASLQEVLTLAAALEVPPVLLFLPIGEDSDVQVTPAVRISAEMAYGWIIGDEEFAVRDPESGANVVRKVSQWGTQALAPVAYLRESNRLAENFYRAESQVRRAEASGNDDEATDARSGVDRALVAWLQHRRNARMAGQKTARLGHELIRRAARLGFNEDEGTTS